MKKYDLRKEVLEASTDRVENTVSIMEAEKRIKTSQLLAAVSLEVLNNNALLQKEAEYNIQPCYDRIENYGNVINACIWKISMIIKKNTGIEMSKMYEDLELTENDLNHYMNIDSFSRAKMLLDDYYRHCLNIIYSIVMELNY